MRTVRSFILFLSSRCTPGIRDRQVKRSPRPSRTGLEKDRLASRAPGSAEKDAHGAGKEGGRASRSSSRSGPLSKDAQGSLPGARGVGTSLTEDTACAGAGGSERPR